MPIQLRNYWTNATYPVLTLEGQSPFDFDVCVPNNFPFGGPLVVIPQPWITTWIGSGIPSGFRDTQFKFIPAAPPDGSAVTHKVTVSHVEDLGGPDPICPVSDGYQSTTDTIIPVWSPSTEFQGIRLRAWIPADYLETPHPTDPISKAYFKGDGPGAGSTRRIEMRTSVRLAELVRYTGGYHEKRYFPDGSWQVEGPLPNCIPCTPGVAFANTLFLHDSTERWRDLLNPTTQCTSTSSYFRGGSPLNLDCDSTTGPANTNFIGYKREYPNQIYTRFFVDAPNPCSWPTSWGVCTIKADLYVFINESPVIQADGSYKIVRRIKVEGRHSRFPAFQLMVGRTVLYAYDPCALGSSPLELCAPLTSGQAVGTGWIEVPFGNR